LAHELQPARASRGADHRRTRGDAIPGKPDFLAAHVIPVGRFGKNPLRWFKALAARCWKGGAMARRLFDSFGPSAVVGFGGYPSLPTLMAATAIEHAQRGARTERGAGPRQSLPCGQGAGDRHRL
jgi:UDP-N-acetylglucosamine:LPS N-acetylglucosamine transferase